MDHTYAAKERSLKNPALYSDMDWEEDEFAKYKLPIDENNLYPVEALCSDMDWSEDEFAHCESLIGADKLYTVENTTSPSSVSRRLLTDPMKDKIWMENGGRSTLGSCTKISQNILYHP